MTDETQLRKLLQLDYVYPIDKNTQFELDTGVLLVI